MECIQWRDWICSFFSTNIFGGRWMGQKNICKKTNNLNCVQCLVYVCARARPYVLCDHDGYYHVICVTHNGKHSQAGKHTHYSCFWNFLHNFLFNELNKYLQSQMCLCVYVYSLFKNRLNLLGVRVLEYKQLTRSVETEFSLENEGFAARQTGRPTSRGREREGRGPHLLCFEFCNGVMDDDMMEL